MRGLKRLLWCLMLACLLAQGASAVEAAARISERAREALRGRAIVGEAEQQRGRLRMVHAAARCCIMSA